MITQYSGRQPLLPPGLEHLAPSCEHVVQRFLEVHGRLGELAAHLFDILLVALLDLVAEQLLQRSALQAFIAL